MNEIGPSATVDADVFTGLFGDPAAEPWGAESLDAEVAEQLRSALESQPAIVDGRLQVKVDERWVTLQGQASDLEWQELERCVLSTRGVKGASLQHHGRRRRVR